MAKKTINLGTGELTGDGESIRSAFSKINDNFDELYAVDHDLSAISESIIPDTDVAYDLGSASNRFRDLYLSGSTIDLGGTTLSVVGGELRLSGTKVPTQTDVTGQINQAVADVVAGSVDLTPYATVASLADVATSGDYNDLTNKPTIPTNINDLGDVALTDPVNGDLLTYFNGEWVNAALLNYVTTGSNVSLLNNDAGYITAADIAGGTLTIDVNNTGNLEGSVYSNESTLLVDGERGKIVGDVENTTINTQNIRSSNTLTGNLLLQGSSTDAGNGGTINIWGGSGFGSGNGGFVAIEAGSASGSGTKGGINIGTSSTATGSVTIGLPLQSSIIVSNDDDSITINGNVDFTDATVSGLSVSAQGFTYTELAGTSEIGVTADVFDFGDGKTIDMQNSTVLFTGSTVSGIFSLNTDYITIGVGGGINMQGSDIGAAGTIGAATVNAVDFNGNLSGTVDGDLTGSVFADDSTLLVDGVNGTIVGEVDTTYVTTENGIGFGQTGYTMFVDESGVLYVQGTNGDDDIVIRTNASGGGQYDWTFGLDGTLTVPGNGKIASPATGNLQLDVGRENGGAFIVTAWEDRNDAENGWKQILWGYDGSKYDFFVGGDITSQGTINTTNISHPSNSGLGLRLNSTDQSTLMVAKQSFDRTFDEIFNPGYTFSMLNTPNRVRVTFDVNNGLYLKELLTRMSVLYENIRLGDPVDFEFDYSNIRLSLEPDAYDIVTNVVDITQFDELIWDIEIDQDPIAVLAAAGKEPGEIEQIALRYDYNNTVGFDIGRNRYGMSVDHEDIDLRAGRDIDLDAADDFRARAGSTFNLHLERNDNQAPDEGININLWNNWNTALEDAKTWTFGFDGNLYLPDGSDLISNNDISITINNFDSTTYTWNFGNTGDLTAPGDITTGLLNVGGRFIQDCADGTTSMRWINVEEGSDTTQILRAYTGDPKQDTEIERAQLLLNWSGDSNEYSGFTIKSFDNTDPNTPGEYDWLFQGDGTLRLPASSIGGGIGLIYSPADKSLWLSGTNVDKTTDGNGVVLNGGQNDGTGRGGGISLFGGNSTGGTGGSIFIESGIGQGGADNGVISIGTAYAKTITIGKASQSANNRFFGNLVGNVENDDDITITVANDDSTTYAWNFGNTGALTLPGDLKLSGGIYSTTSSAIGLIGSWYQDNGTSDGGGVTVQAGAGQRDGGDVAIIAGSTVDRDGGSIYIKSGNSTSGTAGPITIEAGNVANRGTLTARASTFQIDADVALNGARTISPILTNESLYGSDLTIQGGTSGDPNAVGGDVFIDGGAGDGAGTDGTVRINQNTTGGVWIGKADGTGGDIQTYSRLHIQRGVVETYAAKADATGVVEHDCNGGHLFYHTSPDANWTVNLTNLNVYNGMSTNIVIVIEQGGTPYYPSALQIGGAAQTIKWLGNVTPTPSGNKTEIATFTIFYNGSNYNVLGSYSTYG